MLHAPRLAAHVPPPWQARLESVLSSSAFENLARFVERERAAHAVFPQEERVFEALRLVAPPDVRVVILGQDPYHDDGQAHGLAFSVLPGTPVPPSLRNIFKELHADLGVPVAAHGFLSAWARQGILLLNTVLTVRAHEAHSHRGQGWEQVTDAIIRQVQREGRRLIFVLWGAPAQEKRRLIDENAHLVLAAPHPSPLSAHRGFLGSRPFSRINAELSRQGSEPIRWELPQPPTG